MFRRNQLTSLGSPVTSTRRRPIALKMAPVDSPYTPIVSTAISSNWCASARAAYLRCLRSSALFAAVPTSIADLLRCTPAKVSTHVQSQTKLLPPLNGKTVIPSGRDPTPLSNPGGSKTDGRPAFWSALLITSFIANALESGQHCICRTSHANPYCPSSHHSGKNEEYKHQLPL